MAAVRKAGGRQVAAVYAGTFDPFTLGHLDVAERAAQAFSPLIVAVAEAPRKRLLFSTEERVAMAKASLAHIPGVEVAPFDGLLVEWAKAHGVGVVVRGLRSVSDFELEFQMALTNRKLAPEVDTYFLMSPPELAFVSSSMVREVAGLHGPLESFVPPPVAQALRKRFPA